MLAFLFISLLSVMIFSASCTSEIDRKNRVQGNRLRRRRMLKAAAHHLAQAMDLVPVEAGNTAGDGAQLLAAVGAKALALRTLQVELVAASDSGMELVAASDSGMELEAVQGQQQGMGLAEAVEVEVLVAIELIEEIMGLVMEAATALMVVVFQALREDDFSDLEVNND